MVTVMTMDTAFQICLGVAGAFGGAWVWRLQRDIADLERSVEDIKTTYQRREDAKSDFKMMMDTLRDLRAAIDRIDAKLDKKADKL